ncbi:hypothetical protein CHLRE_12g552001v5 [Chlamydomonas reinhardtii]|uniref:Peptidase M48 domain-containing protein n=1 Tax=Chlamydomonas reinhardtii TaxID=3055 RepID=A0A2K3D637_CHLRE|nr:uncharacterized protein CHLRE_12g552001v5 [Chlamydomonas reinhardtii]PNW75988.1 hypothetical protein CHLRE_12g552001v5 [Chlamydomonas reinhardtii]
MQATTAPPLRRAGLLPPGQAASRALPVRPHPYLWGGCATGAAAAAAVAAASSCPAAFAPAAAFRLNAPRRRGVLPPARGLTPWSEAETDPDPEPYIRQGGRRKAAAAAPDPAFPTVDHQYNPPPSSTTPQQQQQQSQSTADSRYSWPTQQQQQQQRGVSDWGDDSAPSAPPLPPQLQYPPPPQQPMSPAAVAAASASPVGAGLLLRRAVDGLLLPALAGGLVGYGLLGLPPGAPLGLAAAAGVLARALFSALAETVPFTGRRHHLLLPLGVELAMGEASFRSFISQQRKAGKILSRRSREHLLVAEVANHVIAAAMRGHGGGSRDHLSRFKWEVVTVDDDTPNAFVLPGGKVVVHSGLLRLLGGRRDLLATVLGHEVAHAVARHGAEKMTLGVCAALALRVLAAAASRTATQGSSQRQAQQQQQRQYDSTRASWPDAGWPSFLGGRPQQRQAAASAAAAAEEEEVDYGLGPGSLVSQLLEGAGASAAAAAAHEYARHAASAAYVGRGGGSPYGGGRGGGGGGGGSLPAGHPLLSPEVTSLLNNVLLQLPFSRRAEAEADLIGLKLMALAGYDPALAPQTFRQLDAAEQHRHRGGGGLGGLLAGRGSPAAGLQKAASLGCTHPRSAHRVKALEAEVAAMVEAGPQGYETVFTHPSYWSL